MDENKSEDPGFLDAFYKLCESDRVMGLLMRQSADANHQTRGQVIAGDQTEEIAAQ